MKPGQRAKRDAAEVAGYMITGKIDLISGCRMLCSLRYKVGAEHEEMFIPIIVFESETERFPVGRFRAQYNKEYLQSLDREVPEYIQYYQSSVLAACKQIVEVLSKETAIEDEDGEEAGT